MSVYVGQLAIQKEQTKQEVTNISLFLLAGICLVAAMGFRVWVKIATIDQGYQLAALRTEAVELDMQRRELELQLSVVTRPDTLSVLAKNEFNFSAPAATQVIRYQPKSY